MSRDPEIVTQSLPSNARLVFQGELFDIYQWEQEMYDGTTAIFEQLARDDSVVVIPVTIDGKILILDQEQPHRGSFTGVVAGGVEKGETPLSTARRELQEETGYDSDTFDEWFARAPYKKIAWTVHVYIARNCRKIGAQELDGGEKIQVREVTYDDYLKEIFLPQCRDKDIILMVSTLLAEGKGDELKKRILG
jgi:ADP-ribose pyrophosphatase